MTSERILKAAIATMMAMMVVAVTAATHPKYAWSNGMSMEQAIASQATPAFIYYLGKDNMQVVYWDEVNRESTEVVDWDSQEGVRALAHLYTNLYTSPQSSLKIEYSGEKLINPDGEMYDYGQLHNEWMPSAGLKYRIVSGNPEPEERGVYAITTEDYAATHKLLPIKLNDWYGDSQDQPLPLAVVGALEEKYSMKAQRSHKVARIGDRYTYGVLQFEPSGDKAIALDVLIDGSNAIYSVAHEGMYEPQYGPTWNVDDEGIYLPCRPLVAFADNDGVEICFVRYAPESCAVGVMRLCGESFVRDDLAIYYVNIDEGYAKPLWKKDLAKMEAIYQSADPENKDVTFNHWAYLDIDGDGIDEIWLRDENDEDGAIFSLRDAEPVMICTEDHRAKASFYKGRICVSGPAGGPSYTYEDYTLRDSRVEHCLAMLTVEGEIDACALDEVEIDPSRAKELRAQLPNEPLDIYPTWQYVQWR